MPIQRRNSNYQAALKRRDALNRKLAAKKKTKVPLQPANPNPSGRIYTQPVKPNQKNPKVYSKPVKPKPPANGSSSNTSQKVQGNQSNTALQDSIKKQLETEKKPIPLPDSQALQEKMSTSQQKTPVKSSANTKKLQAKMAPKRKPKTKAQRAADRKIQEKLYHANLRKIAAARKKRKKK